MQINSFNATSLAGAVWANATRTLTSDPSSPTAVFGRSTLAATTMLDVRPGVGAFRNITVLMDDVTTHFTIGLYDGTNYDAVFTGVAVPSLPSGFGNATRGVAINNTDSSGHTVAYAGWDIT